MPREVSAIEADLTVAYAARTRILSAGQQKGADGASKSEANLKDVSAIIRELQTELSLASTGRGGGISFTPTMGN